MNVNGLRQSLKPGVKSRESVGEECAGNDDCLRSESMQEVGDRAIVSAGDNEIVAGYGLPGAEIAHGG